MMRTRFPWAGTLACTIFAFVTTAAAAAPADHPLTGVWAGDGVQVLVFDLPNGTYCGSIEKGGRLFPFDAKADGASVAGKFQHEGDAYDFALATRGEDATLTSGDAKHALKRKTWDPFVAVGDLINAKDYERAWAQLRPLNERKQPHSLFVAALMHQNGWGVAQDLAKANAFYARGADVGHVSCMLNLGVSHRDGRGTAKDPAKALELFTRAALWGNSQAAWNAGALLANAEPPANDPVEALAWLSLSNEQAATDAAAKLEAKLDAAQKAAAGKRADELAGQRAANLKPRAAKAAGGSVGFTVSIKDGKPVVASVKAGSQAERSEVKVGDVLVKVDNADVAGKSLEELNKLLAGEPDSLLQLHFDRNGGNVQVVMPREAAGN